MTAALLSLVVTAAPLAWDGRSPVELDVGATMTLALPRAVRFVSIGGGDVVDVGVSRDLCTVQLKGLRAAPAPSSRTSRIAPARRSS